MEKSSKTNELVNATQLSQWAATRGAQDLFPELVRRLLAATVGVTGISVRSGDGVAAPGWDGRARSRGASFLPDGDLCFEFGVDKQPKSKADDDYEKRRDRDAAGVNRAECVFVFMTPRRWAGAEAWATSRRAEAIFADVQVLDADDLEGWLHRAPAVHYWISERLGGRPKDAESLDSWWDRFQARSTLSSLGPLFLAGRHEEQSRLVQTLAGPPAVVSVQSGWREEVLAFIAAALATEADGPPALTVSNRDVWDRVVAERSRTVLIPLFENANINSALVGGHHVIVPIGKDQITGNGETIELPRLSRRETGVLLEAEGIPSRRAYDLAALARRSMPSMIRSASKDPAFARPPWSQASSDSAILAPLVLLGSWKESQEDISLASFLAGAEWPEIEKILLHWRNTDDPPFIRTAGGWHAASAVEAFQVLNPLLSNSAMRRWQESLTRAFKFSEEVDQNQQNGNPGVHISELARRGLAQGVALLGTEGNRTLADTSTCGEYARRAVFAILRCANEDDSGTIWGLLGVELMLLAEGAPEEFIDAVHFDLDSREPVLRHLFQGDDNSFSHPSYTGLLWSLEVLCWSPEYLIDAALALSRLHLIDPGGRWANRPLESLISILSGWIKNTSATHQDKIRTVETICRRVPEMKGELPLRLLPSSHRIIIPPESPRFRDWMPDDRKVAIPDLIEYTSRLVTFAILAAQEDPKLWSKLVDSVGTLPASECDRIFEALDRAMDSFPDSTDRIELWENLREMAIRLVDRQSTTEGEDDYLSRVQDLASRLEPATDPARFAYLFDWQPSLDDTSIVDDYEGYVAKLWDLRSQAILKVLEEDSLMAIARLAIRSNVPDHLGLALGEAASEILTPEIATWLDSEDISKRSVAAGWARKRLIDKGADWLRDALELPELQQPARRIVLALNSPAESAFWDVILEVDADLYASYWENVSEIRIDSGDRSRAARAYIDHGRAWLAIDLVQAWAHREGGLGSVPPSLIEEALDAALAADPQTSRSQYPGYGIGRILDYLESKGAGQEKIAYYEFGFYGLLDDRRENRALLSTLNQDPSLFVKLVSLAYKGKNEGPRSLDAQSRNRATLAWEILRDWPSIPGSREDGGIDQDRLNSWVRAARAELDECDRGDIGDEIIGQILSSCAVRPDETWPPEEVREIIDVVGSKEIDTGFYVGTFNRRGVTSRDVFEGGRQERELAERYREWAREVSHGWPRTARVLRGIAESYESQAQREDSEAATSADTE